MDNDEVNGQKGKPSLVEIETTKFFANFIDRAATALLVGGVLTPFFVSPELHLIANTEDAISAAGVWVFCAIVLHCFGHATLMRLR